MGIGDVPFPIRQIQNHPFVGAIHLCPGWGMNRPHAQAVELPGRKTTVRSRLIPRNFFRCERGIPKGLLKWWLRPKASELPLAIPTLWPVLSRYLSCRSKKDTPPEAFPRRSAKTGLQVPFPRDVGPPVSYGFRTKNPTIRSNMPKATTIKNVVV